MPETSIDLNQPLKLTPIYKDKVWGGATLILGPSGGVRYAITKDPDSAWRLERQRAFLASDEGRRFWQAAQTGGDLFGLLHRPAPSENGSE